MITLYLVCHSSYKGNCFVGSVNIKLKKTLVSCLQLILMYNGKSKALHFL